MIAAMSNADSFRRDQVPLGRQLGQAAWVIVCCHAALLAAGSWSERSVTLRIGTVALLGICVLACVREWGPVVFFPLAAFYFGAIWVPCPYGYLHNAYEGMMVTIGIPIVYAILGTLLGFGTDLCRDDATNTATQIAGGVPDSQTDGTNQRSTKRGGPLLWLAGRPRRFWIGAALVLTVLYVAGVGPANWLHRQQLLREGSVPSGIVKWFYAPLEWLLRNAPKPIADALHW